MRNARDILIYLALKHEGDWDAIYDDVKEKISINDDASCMKVIESLPYNAITIIDRNYPECLRRINRPPFVLFYYGDLSYLNDLSSAIAVVGSREASEYGERVTEQIVKGLSSRHIIVSGMAKGIDAIAHNTAINHGGRTIAILGTGINHIYPIENKGLYEKLKKDHLILSEYPGNTSFSPYSFPKRNRIITALANSLLVTEAYDKSGTLITVMHALEQGKDVMCVPYPVGSNSKCNSLIKEGATMVETAKEVEEVLDMKK